MSEQPKVLLFVTTDVPWPADSGGRIKTFQLVKHWSATFEVRLLCVRGLHNASACKRESGAAVVQSFDQYRGRTLLTWIDAIVRFPTLNTARVYSKPFEAMLKASLPAADVVVIDHLEMLEMVPDRWLPKVIYHSHNAEFVVWRDFASHLPFGLKRIGAWLESERVKAFERRVLKMVKFTFMAPSDAEVAKAELGAASPKLRPTLHLGDEAFLKHPPITTNSQKVFYAGTLSWEPNRDGLLWLLRTVWPLVRQQLPDAQLCIAGRGADRILSESITKANGVKALGFVPNLHAAMAECGAAVVPLRFGSGMKIKTLDALYAALPLACTTVAVQGIDLVHGTHALIGDSPSALANNLVELLRNRPLALELAANGRTLASTRYTYGPMLEGMTAALD